MLKRILDITAALFGLLLLWPLMLVAAITVRLDSPGPALHWSKRIGRHNRLFLMPKFRSMRIDTPQVATHLLDGKSHLTRVGPFLRRSSIDELPQLWSVLVGEMSLVGPRPALFNQDDLIALRTAQGVDQLRPGVTGWAQVNGRDSVSVPEKVDFDAAYRARQSFGFDLKILFMTVANVVRRQGISH